MAVATPSLPDMKKEDADKVVQRIMYRKKQAKLPEIEESFRRSVESSGLSVRFTINTSLKRLMKKGKVKKLKRKEPTFQYQVEPR